MPYEWQKFPDVHAAQVTVWPHRSLPKKHFAGFILITWAMMMIPAFALIGTSALWAVLPFLTLAIALIWYFLDRSYKDGSLTEVLYLTSDSATLTRTNPRSQTQTWSANPHWVEVSIHRTKGPVENYITLRGGGRTVELGAFLSPDERAILYEDLCRAFAQARRPAPG